jgi:HK97 family phage portal protein/HK97 family phage prohead protease
VTLPATAARQNWWAKTVTTLANWLVAGESPKFRDPQNAAARSGGTSGVAVDAQAAMTVATFFACLRLVASTIAVLPLPVFRKGRDGVATEARDSQLWKVLHDSPNADQTSLDYIEFLVVSLIMRGDHFARKLRDGSRLIGLEPVRPDLVTVRRVESGEIRYRWSEGGKAVDLGEDDVFHVRGFGGGPLGGLSVLAYARESLGLAIAADRAAASMFANGVRASGVLTFKEWLQPEQRDSSREIIEQTFAGALNAGRPMILEGGSDWKQISMNADDAQLLESRGWSVEEVCRWFGVPPVLIGHSEKQTSWGTGVEQIVLGFLKFTLTPYLRRIELAIAKQLMTPAERAQGMFAQFNVEGLLRADSLNRARYLKTMVDSGLMTRNEGRAKENLPPVDGGDVITVQSQNISLEEAVRNAIEDGSKSRGGIGRKRSLKVRDFALCVKADKVGEDGTFEGYGSVYGVVDSYQEVVAPGAFAESLAELNAKQRRVPVLWQHRSDQPIGVYAEITEDDTGLFVKGQLLIDAVAQASEAHALMKAGAVTGLSIGYWVRESSFDEKTGIRTLTKLDLVEVSLVTFPANDDARVEAVKFKLAHGELPNIREFEKLLREAGFSKTQAAVVAGHGLQELLRREAEGDATKEGVEILSAAVADFRLPTL